MIFRPLTRLSTQGASMGCSTDRRDAIVVKERRAGLSRGCLGQMQHRAFGSMRSLAGVAAMMGVTVDPSSPAASRNNGSLAAPERAIQA